MRPEDRVRIQHILDACESIARFLAGRQREDLDADEMLLFALLRAVEIIGEAATRVSEEARSLLPAVPWARIVAMRNRLIHGYFEVNNDIVWRTATEDVPTLAAALAHLKRGMHGDVPG
jgi:uncharacterized protein with HEPN domain